MNTSFDALIEKWAEPQKQPRTRTQYKNTMHELEAWLAQKSLTFTSDPQAIVDVVKVWKKHLKNGSGEAKDYHQRDRVSRVRTFYAFLIRHHVSGITTNPIDRL